MQRRGDRTLFSASDLVAFLECQHRTTLDVINLETPMERAKDSDEAKLVQDKGFEHEGSYLESLRAAGVTVADLGGDDSNDKKIAATEAALAEGAEIIYQATLTSGHWIGHTDFLRRIETPSALGAWSYEVADTKLAHHAKPKFLIQLAFYSDLLGQAQGLVPKQMHLVLGDRSEHSYRLADFTHYYQRLKQRFEDFVATRPETYPEQCDACGFCPWRDRCAEQWRQDDHLNGVAGISKVQIKKLRHSGVTTLAQLAGLAPSASLPRMQPDTLSRLRAQAALQLSKRETGHDQLELLPRTQGSGFDRLPPPDAGDLFFDMEGDPHYPDGLEYLFGVYYFEDGQPLFREFWAHNRSEEKVAFASFVDFAIQHLEQHPGAHIYHYAHYEPTALKRLMSMHGTREARIDQLLRDRRFVDLYKVVRESIRTSEPAYSIKNLETFYMEKRAGDVTSAGASIVYYENWRQTQDDSLLKMIRDYNEDDCRSTHLLREWLGSIAPDANVWAHGPTLTPEHKEKSAKTVHHEARLAELEEQLLSDLPEVRSQWTADHHMRELVFQLLDFHRREAKPRWWAQFARQDMSEEELLDDAECIAGLRLVEPKHSDDPHTAEYCYPEQDFKLRAGDQVLRTDTRDSFGTIGTIDEDARTIQIRPSTKVINSGLPTSVSIGLGGPIPTYVITKALFRFAESVVDDDDRFRSAKGFLRRESPRVRGRVAGRPIVSPDAPSIEEICEAVAKLDHSTLFIQGPPGTGKTFTGSHVIVDLLKRGMRVGVSSNSHKAIHNLLNAVEQRAEEQNVNFAGVYKSSGRTRDSEFDSPHVQSVGDKAEILLALSDPQVNLCAGTAWLFADEQMEHALDYLFVDEAGQVSTANLVAMATCARNIVLLGDQMQLGQPIQGVHPGESGQSALEFLLQGRATIPSDRGIFLGTTWRMHPDVCQFISEAVYEGRLRSEPKNAAQRLILASDADERLRPTGLRFVPVVHDGCSQRSEEEAEVISALYNCLLAQHYRCRQGRTHPMTTQNILVVAPYNMQVNLLRRTLPEGARVGTVDKFQGQEAEVVIVSMATSNADTLPRNIEFLYSKNRLNVAISRARSLAILVANPELADIYCTNERQIELVSLMCHAVDFARN